jgi:4-hydroxy-2-oxoheptanedioate aldolase
VPLLTGAGPRRRLLATSGVVRGIFLKLATTPIVDIVAGSSFDFAIIDREHSQLSEREALELIARARLHGLPALLRLPAVDPGPINRALEAGAAGIQVSMVRSVEQVTALRRASRYAPRGERSVSLTHPTAAYGRLDLDEYHREQEADPPLIVVQIETEDTDDPLEEILAAGADVAFIGGLDLRLALRADPQAYQARIEAIASAAQRTRTALGGAGIDDRRIVYAADHSDIGLFGSACDGALAAATTAAGNHERAACRDPKRQLENLLVEFNHRLDMHAGRGVAELFAVDGTFTLDGRTLRGRDEIRAGYEQRASRGARTARHLIANVRVTMLTADRARIESYMVLYAADGEPVHTSEAPLVVGDYHDIATREPGGEWQFESRELTTQFRGSGPVVSPAGES